MKRAFGKPARLSPVDALRQAAAVASTDATRPVFHFLPPANWMNDPNGPIYHDGYYHLFYQHNPMSDSWANIHWGHARSTDLVRWEHLPIALWPSAENDEGYCYSGTSVIRQDGTPTIFYTKVGPEGAAHPFEQWMALGDEELIRWEKPKYNPILSLEKHDGPAVRGDWRDPFVIEHGEATLMVLGAVLTEPPEERAAVLLYKATDESLTAWEFQSVLLSSPKYEREFLECPNFFPLGTKWVLCVSPYHPVEYYVGTFDGGKLEFAPQRKGRVDHSIDFYASNTFCAPDGRRIVVGWIRGFKKGRMWNGCLSLPREVELGSDDVLLQRPAEELKSLRGKHYEVPPQTLQNEDFRIPELRSATLEIWAQLRPLSAGRFGIRVRMGESENSGIEIALESDMLIVGGLSLHLPDNLDHHSVDLHLFLDNSVLELFACGGRTVVTKIIYPPDENLGIGLFSDGRTELEEFHAWQLEAAPVAGFPG